MQQIEKILSELDLSKSEVEVYLSALALGEASVHEIAHKAKLARTTVGSILERLAMQGLVSVQIRAGKRIYWVENPAVLADSFQEKSVLAKQLNIKVQNLYRRSDKKPKVEIFENEKAIIKLINKTIDELPKGSEILTYDTPLASNYIQVMSEEMFAILTLKKASKGIRTRSLIPYGQEVFLAKLKVHPSIEIRVAPVNVDFESSTWLFNNSLVLFSGAHVSAICITNKAMKDGFTSFFEYIWQRSTPVKRPVYV